MTEEEKKLVEQFGITVTQKSVYTYKGYKYDHLKDAVNYARIDTERQDTAGEAAD